MVMAKEFGPRGITVNCIMPGLIASDANAEIRANPETKKYFEDNILLGRIGEPSSLGKSSKSAAACSPDRVSSPSPTRLTIGRST